VSLINSKVAQETGLLSKNTPTPLFNLFGPAAPATIRSLEIAGLKARSIPVIVMDHPTVEVLAELVGPIEGILGFPFFARYQMTLDYRAKQLPFPPSGLERTDIWQPLMGGLLARDKPATKVLAPAALWGFRIGKRPGDETAGVAVTGVLP